jgi:TfoX/Sxy family transcriptional regulator of competence genes
MAYDEDLADRIRQVTSGVPGLTEKKMFGGIAFMVNGNMACGPIKNGLMVRIGPDAYEEALEQPEASELGFTGRPMRGMIEVGSEALADDEVLEDWVRRGIDFASSLPPK